MDPNDPSNFRIPAILIPSYNNVMKRPSGRADLKRISVRCGVCRQLRYYSLSRGITRINRVVACEACRHCYQAFKRDPTPLICNKGNGSCWHNLLFPKTKCRCCWVTQMLESTPISQDLYDKFSAQLPDYIKCSLRGHPVAASSLSQEQRGYLALEVHTGSEWQDMTEESAVVLQRRSLEDKMDNKSGDNQDDEEDAAEADGLTGVDVCGAAASEATTRSSSSGFDSETFPVANTKVSIPEPPPKITSVKSVAGSRGRHKRGKYKSKLKISRAIIDSEDNSNSSSAENSQRDLTAVRGKATKRTRGGGGTGKRGGRGGKKGLSKVDRVMAGIKEGLYGMSVSDDKKTGPGFKKFPPPGPGISSCPQSSNYTSSDTSEPPSRTASPTPMEEEVTVEEEFEELLQHQLQPISTKAATLKPEKSASEMNMIGLVHSEQKKFLKDFNPRNSARVRRKKDRIEYFDSTKTHKVSETLVHDHKGRFIGCDRELHDACDCLQEGCPGCHFPCPKCRSPKCGAECRTNRKWFYERIDVEGTEQFYLNRFLKA